MENLDSLCRRLSGVLSQDDELILVDDCSSDNSWTSICRLSDSKGVYGFSVKGIRLDQNRGQQAALLAALTLSNGKQVVTMDDDASHPVEAIPAFLTQLRNGADLVYAQPPRRSAWSIRNCCSKLHQFHVRMITGSGRHVRVGSFRAMSGTLVSRLLHEHFTFPYLSLQCLSLRPKPRVAMIETIDWPASRISRFRLSRLIALEIRLAVEYGVFSRLRKQNGTPLMAQASEWIAEKTWK